MLRLHDYLVLVLGLERSLLAFQSLQKLLKFCKLGLVPLLLVVEQVLNLQVFGDKNLVKFLLALERLRQRVLQTSDL